MQKQRIPFIALALLSLLAGLLTGLHRIGWALPLDSVSRDHGSIMIGGFLGTLISLEKVIPLKRRTVYVIPLISSASVVMFFLNLPAYSVIALIIASVGLATVFVIYWLRERSLIYWLMSAGAACWLTGNVLLLTNTFYPLSVPWWMAFVLLIIAAERLELMKFLPVTPKQKTLFALMLAVFVVACLLTFHGPGSYIASLALITTSLWLMRYDVVGINLKKVGLSRYTGAALVSGYFSLLICGLFIPLLSSQPLGYDAIVHSFFIGFVFAMIFAHGPIILPGVLGISAKPYHPVLYLWLLLLHASWISRALADIALAMPLRRYSGVVSMIAITGYFISMIILLFVSQRSASVAPRQ